MDSYEKLNINDNLKEYFKILSNEFPEWLLDYINTKEMQRIHKISTGCGTDYAVELYKNIYNVSNLEHSIGVALIIWNFTKDKKQTLAGLFHDIATPVFKHCIDFLNGDHKNQESTEEKTYEIIKNSEEIMGLLKRDNIDISEVYDYKLYGVADNDTPRLAADRLEYTFAMGMIIKGIIKYEDVQEIYNDLTVAKNEDGIEELTFKTQKICEKCITNISELWYSWVDKENRTVMQFLADVVKVMIKLKYLTMEQLYELSEEEVVNMIRNCENDDIRKAFKNFEKIDIVYETKEKIKGRYCINVKSKERYINPQVVDKGRIYDISDKARNIIDKYLQSNKIGWTYLNFEFDIEKILDSSK